LCFLLERERDLDDLVAVVALLVAAALVEDLLRLRFLEDEETDEDFESTELVLEEYVDDEVDDEEE
jgi:hypothetical protein